MKPGNTLRTIDQVRAADMTLIAALTCSGMGASMSSEGESKSNCRIIGSFIKLWVDVKLPDFNKRGHRGSLPLPGLGIRPASFLCLAVSYESRTERGRGQPEGSSRLPERASRSCK
jgi:hypothetical protein